MLLTIDDALQKAVEAHKANKIQEADRLYTVILQTQPKHPDANHNMGVLAVSVGKLQEALPFFKTALTANPSVGQFWLSYIDALIKSGQIVDAETVLAEAKGKRIKDEVLDQLEQKLSSQNGVTVNAGVDNRGEDQTRINILDSLKLDQALRLAKKKVKEESPEDAKRIYNDILARFPKNKKAIDGIESLSAGFIGKSPKVLDPPPKQLQSIISLYNQGQPQQALSDVSQMLKKFPNSTTLYNIAGACNAGLMKFDAAIVSYKKALKINPDNAEIYNNMGNAFKSIGDVESALVSYNRAVKINPDFAEAYYNMGNTLHQMGDLESALVSYNRAVKINPDFAEAHYRIGGVINDQGDFDAAINSYKVAIKHKPDYAEAYIDMGNALNDQGNLEASIDSYKRAIKIKPNYAEAYYNMGLVLYSKGNLDSAIDSYKQALQIKPDNAEAYIDMGNAFKAKDDLQAAADSYRQAITLKHDYFEAYSNLGNVLVELRQFDSAYVNYEKAINLNEDYDLALLGLGNMLLRKGRHIEGINKLRQAAGSIFFNIKKGYSVKNRGIK